MLFPALHLGADLPDRPAGLSVAPAETPSQNAALTHGVSSFYSPWPLWPSVVPRVQSGSSMSSSKAISHAHHPAESPQFCAMKRYFRF